MLDHLDDPQPFVPSEGFRQEVVTRGRRRRRWQRLGLSSAAAVVVLGGIVGAGLLAVDRRDAAIDRTTITSTPSTDGATNVLVVGTDDEPRADTIVVVRLEAGTVRLLSIPRDLWNTRTSDRMNADVGDALVDEVTAVTGVPIDHYLQLDMDGFVDLVDAAGGVRLRVDEPMRDSSSGLALSPSSCTTLDGNAALALTRSRHLEVQRGHWVVDRTGDFGRMARGRIVLAAALDGLFSRDDVVGLVDGLSRLLADHAVVDDGLDLDGIRALGRTLLASTVVGSETLPVYDDVIDGAAVLRPAAGATDVARRFGAPELAAPRRPSGLGAVRPFVGLGPC